MCLYLLTQQLFKKIKMVQSSNLSVLTKLSYVYCMLLLYFCGNFFIGHNYFFSPDILLARGVIKTVITWWVIMCAGVEKS